MPRHQLAGQLESEQVPDTSPERDALVDVTVETLRPCDQVAVSLDPHRLEAGHLVAFLDGRDIGIHPVMIAVLAAVVHHPHPGLALLDGVPEILEGRRRHVRVTDDIVVLAQQFLLAETAGTNEVLVDVPDDPFPVRGGNNLHGGIQDLLLAAQGKVLFHTLLLSSTSTTSGRGHPVHKGQGTIKGIA